jgi:sigma-B regulation protein RsbU (phosphoserine phosphatase)
VNRPALPDHSTALTAQGEEHRQSLRALKIRGRRAIRRAPEGWRRLTAGMELNDLWTQFKAEAEASSRPYKQDINRQTVNQSESWKQPFKIVSALLSSILNKLSPPRRIFLLITIVVAFASISGLQFLFITKDVEFLLAFGGLLILLVLVLGDHVTMKRDIEIAREIQRRLVPRVPPEMPGVDLAFATRPAKMVAGDYFDAFRRTKDGPLLIAVADVSGKSVPAAMLMANFQAALRALAGSRSSLAELVIGLNRLACSNNLNGRRFTTAFVAELDSGTGELRYVSAGHNPPILKRRDGSIERLSSESMPLGVELDEHYESGTTQLSIADLLVIFTDGVTEARNEDGEEFGDKRLVALLEEPQKESAGVTHAHIMRELDKFVGQAAQHDDITCLVLRRV